MSNATSMDIQLSTFILAVILFMIIAVLLAIHTDIVKQNKIMERNYATTTTS